MLHSRRTLSLFVASLAIATFAVADPAGAGSESYNFGETNSGPYALARSSYGTADEVAHVINAYAFEPFSDPLGSVRTDAHSHGYRWLTAGSQFWIAPVLLPQGALMTAIEFQGCDTTALQGVGVILYSSAPGEVLLAHGSVFTGTDGVFACDHWWSAVPAANATIDNSTRTYFVQVTQNGPTYNGNHRLAAVRIYYKLQVTPAPGTATFADVPVGHALHQFVEAVAASGITAGCGGGNFCPNDPLTRGQMAVFLAKALGLHWAP